MSSFTEAAHDTARRATRKTRRHAQRVRNAAVKARRATARKITSAARTVARAAGWTGRKTARATVVTARATVNAVQATFRFAGKAIWWVVSLAWTLVSTAIALVAYAAAWLLSLCAGGIFALGVGLAMIAMLLTGNIPTQPAPPAYVHASFIVKDDRPAPDHFDPDSFVRDDSFVEAPISMQEMEAAAAVVHKMQFDDALEKGNRDRASYYFGKHQAAEAIAAGQTNGRAWALVAKELRNSHTLIRKEVKRGWDEEFDNAPKLVVTH